MFNAGIKFIVLALATVGALATPVPSSNPAARYYVSSSYDGHRNSPDPPSYGRQGYGYPKAYNNRRNYTPEPKYYDRPHY
ncbi:hypothetical protein NP233_g1099 [Leucocoprinus birnbaumii]|uniref:Uncharacterized protein n=1 Tax=Leucocoprinus birnbaumii TaxID=56174 RepID=A0AAD5YY85_9AGAR|nr:hypothetical protein NP233_g1099 [Leucocoprinus birnbaumii]